MCEKSYTRVFHVPDGIEKSKLNLSTKNLIIADHFSPLSKAFE